MGNVIKLLEILFCRLGLSSNLGCVLGAAAGIQLGISMHQTLNNLNITHSFCIDIYCLLLFLGNVMEIPKWVAVMMQGQSEMLGFNI